MLTRDDPRLLDLAHAIANGLPVAWDELEASATDPSDRTLIRQFQVLARLSALHAAQPSVERTPPPAPARSPKDPHRRSGDARTRADGTARWGPFDLREQIGAGGFGVVYRAWYPELQKHVALKLLHREISRTADQESALIDEARRLARVRHPNVIVVFGADRHDGIVGFWMELVKGVTLAQLLLDRGPFGPREAALVGIDICQALAAVHHAGLVHGDLKARNVMREQGGRHLLMDFGAATELRRLLLQT